jgi:hypothetical protein
MVSKLDGYVELGCAAHVFGCSRGHEKALR